MLARLDDSARAVAALALAQAGLAAARSALAESEVRRDQAKQTLDRDTLLPRDGVIDAGRSGPAQADVRRATWRGSPRAREQVTWPRSRSRSMQTDLDNTVIRAPFSGIAISKDAQPGEMVSPVSAGGGFTRTGICTIVDMRSLEIDVDVNESYINRVEPGQQRHRRARRLSGLADPRAGDHRRADGGPPEGDRHGAHRLRARSTLRASCRTWSVEG